MRFRLESRLRDEKWILELAKPYTDNVSLFVPEGSGYRGRHTGMNHSLSSRDLPYRTIVFELPDHLDPHLYFYLRMSSSTAMSMPIRIWSSKGFYANSWQETFIFGVVNGILACMILYNFFIYLSLRQRAYLFYVCYMGSNLIYQLSIHGQTYMFLGLTGKTVGCFPGRLLPSR